MINRLGVVGSGNVGSALLMELAANHSDCFGELEITARDEGRAHASVMDVGSAYPEVASRFEYSDGLSGSYDVVVVTAGVLPGPHLTGEQILEANFEIAKRALASCEAQTLVVIGTPVDVLNEEASKQLSAKAERFIGFGGELDKARSKFGLIQSGVQAEPVYAVGEHGPRTIPTYPGEEKYEAVATYATSTLKEIMKKATVTRNLATGVQLGRLVAALSGKKATHCVSVPDPDHHNLSITWPYEIEGDKLTKMPLELGSQAQTRLHELVKVRLARSQTLRPSVQ